MRGKLNWAFGTVLLISNISGATAFDKASQQDYLLGPLDKIEVRVLDLRPGTGEAHKWGAFDGEFYVNAAGNVSLPLIGEVQAAGETTAELARNVAAKMQARIGLSQLPDASIQIVKYRPFYISGDIERPGEYDYRPGLTVVQAISIAGGPKQSKDMSPLEYDRDLIARSGDIHALVTERRNLLLKKARIAAEISEIGTIETPADIKSSGDDAGFASAMREERLLFENKRSAMKAQLEAIARAKDLLLQEIRSLDIKDAALSKQIDLQRQELAQVSALVAKGLAVAPRQLSTEQSVAAYESSRTDVQVARLRAQQELSRFERDALDIRSKYRNESLIEARDVDTKIAIVSEKINSQEALIRRTQASNLSDSPMLGVSRSVSYELIRRVNGISQSIVAKEGDPIEPGDVLRLLVSTKPLKTSESLSIGNDMSKQPDLPSFRIVPRAAR